MRKLGVVFIGSIFFAVAQDAIALDLSLSQATEKILAKSEDLKKADANVKKAEASLDAANANRWFNIEGSATYMNLVNVADPTKAYGVDLPPKLGGLITQFTGKQTDHLDIPDNIFMAGVSVTQPIYTFGKIGNAVEGVRSAIKMSEAGREITRREVKYAAANVYWTAKMTDEIEKISK